MLPWESLQVRMQDRTHPMSILSMWANQSRVRIKLMNLETEWLGSSSPTGLLTSL